MPYSITTYSGSSIATVQDATINTTSTALTLIGRDYAGYGAFLNENFIYLLENFAGSIAPSQKLNGQIWYDTGVNTLKVWNSGANIWKPISSSIAQSIEPDGSTSSLGDLWLDTDTSQLYVYNNGWKLVGPGTVSTDGTTSGPLVEVIKDSSDNDHTVLKFYIKNQVIAIISYDPLFVPKNSINGFSTIVPGLNLVNSSTVAGAQFTGDTVNALTLNGVTSSQFLRSDQNTTTPHQLTVGNLVIGGAFDIGVAPATNEVKASSVLNGYNFNIYSNIAGSSTKILGINGTTGAVSMDSAVLAGSTLNVVGTFTASGPTTLVGVTTLQNNILPSANGTLSIGSNTQRFGNVYANTIVSGTISGAVEASSVKVGNILIGTDDITVSGTSFATQAYVTTSINTPGKNSQGAKIVSTSPPSGSGDNGDIWYQV